MQLGKHSKENVGEEIAGDVAVLGVERFTGAGRCGGWKVAEWEFEVWESEEQEPA